MIKRLVLLLCIALVGLPTIAAASMNGRRAAAERLFATMRIARTLNASIGTMMDLQVQQKPELAPYKGVMLQFLRKYLSYQAMKGSLVDLYARAFTEKELDQLNAFYQTPTGQKAIRLLPQLMKQGMYLGMQRVHAHMPELKAMIRAEARRLAHQGAK